MTTNRFVLLGLLAVPCLSSVSAQTPPAPTFEERLAARAAESRHAVHFKDGAFSGPGWDLLVKEGQASRFFLVGEEHGVAEIPAVVPRTKKSDPELMRIVHGFDAILVLTGSRPAQMPSSAGIIRSSPAAALGISP